MGNFAFKNTPALKNTLAIEAKQLSKRFVSRGHGRALHITLERTMRSVIPTPGERARSKDKDRWALCDVSFEIERGECVALIGHNGAGKSVLLRVLSRVTRPTAGEAFLYGRVGAVLDVGVGFNRELTGLENIFLQGAILGIRKKDLAKKLDAIIDLSGMSEFLQEPLKTYSNGMQVRLAFAVAAQLEPEILMMDEVLAVADEDFIHVCVEKLRELKRQGRTIVLASHDLSLLEQVCDRALWLETGRLVGNGPIETVAKEYHAHMRTRPQGFRR